MDPWLDCQISESVSYRVTLSSGRVVKRHQDHLRHYVSTENESEQETIETPLFPSPTVPPSLC